MLWWEKEVRRSTTSGCNIHTGPDGIPVLTVEADDPHLWNADAGKYIGGNTQILDSGITVYIRYGTGRKPSPMSWGTPWAARWTTRPR